MGMRVICRLDVKDLSTVADQARWAESIGYDSLSSAETSHDPFLPLALAASATSEISLETRLAIAFPRSPMVVANVARDLQDYSKGRFRLGLGTQVKGHNLRRFSVPWVSPGPRLREYVQSLHAIWETWQEGTKLDFHGEHYNFTLMTPMFSPGPSSYARPPVNVGAVNPYHCQVAGEVCDGLLLHSINSPRYMTEVIIPAVEKGAAKSGRSRKDVTIGGGGFVLTGPTKDAIQEQRDALKRQTAFYCSTRTYFPVLEVHGFQEVGQRLHEMSLRGQWAEMGQQVSDEMVDTFTVMAEYDEVAGRIKEKWGGVLDEISFHMDTSSPDDERILKRIIEDLKD